MENGDERDIMEARIWELINRMEEKNSLKP